MVALRIIGLAARVRGHMRIGFRGVGNPIECGRNLGDELVA